MRAVTSFETHRQRDAPQDEARREPRFAAAACVENDQNLHDERHAVNDYFPRHGSSTTRNFAGVYVLSLCGKEGLSGHG